MTTDIDKQFMIDRYRQPRFNEQVIAATHQAANRNVLCGDELSLQLRLEQGVVMAATWRGEGCAISQAAADILAEKLIGLTVDEVSKLNKDDVLGWLKIEIRPARMKCALLALETLKQIEL